MYYLDLILLSREFKVCLSVLGMARLRSLREVKRRYWMFRMRLLVIRNVYKEREREGFVMGCREIMDTKRRVMFREMLGICKKSLWVE